MKYAISHCTRYVYDCAALLSHHAARLTPRTFNGQTCISTNLAIDPAPAAVQEGADYFGNHMTIFAVQEAHQTLTVTAESVVEVFAPQPVNTAHTASWHVVRDALARPGIAELGPSEFIHPSPLVPLMDELQAYGAESFPFGRPILAGARDLTRRIHTDFAYDPGATTVSTPLDEVWRLKRGVCQDFAHLQIGCLRALGLAARYVSGYLLSHPPPGQPRLVGADASHAWLSIWMPELGWIDLDPTNDMMVGEEHIACAWGRDFDDVSPLKGVVVGGGDHSIHVAVDVMPLP